MKNRIKPTENCEHFHKGWNVYWKPFPNLQNFW